MKGASIEEIWHALEDFKPLLQGEVENRPDADRRRQMLLSRMVEMQPEGP